MKKLVLITGFMVVFLAMVVNAQIPDSSAIRVLNLSDWDIHNVSNYIINQEPDPAEPGGYVEIRFKVENMGGGVAENAVFELIPEHPFSLLPGDNGRRTVGDIYGRQVGEEAVILYYKLKVAEDAVEGDNEIRLRYTLDQGESWVTLKPVEIRVESHDILLAVDSVESMPQVVKPGAQAKLRIKLKNLADANVENIRVQLELLRKLQSAQSIDYRELPFSPIGSSSEKTITRLSPGKIGVVDFNLAVDADAEAKVYKIPLSISYSGELGKNYTSSQLVSMEVGDAADMVVTLSETDLYSPGQSGEVNVKFVNKGSSQVRFVYAQLKDSDDYTIISPQDVYIGDIDSDDYETATFKMYLNQGVHEKVTLPLHMEYADSSNQEFEEDIELEMPVYSQEEQLKYGLKQKSNALVFVIAIGLVIAAIVGYRKWKKGKRKKQ